MPSLHAVSRALCLWGLCLWLGLAQAATPDLPPLRAQTSAFEHTGDYAEVERQCRALQQRHPQRVRCQRFGTTAEGRGMYALVVGRPGALTPTQTRLTQTPVVLLIGGSHAGEIDGKDAGLLLLRDWLDRPSGANLLQHQTLVFVPVFNIDGHERPAAHNRPNQNGPRLQGERVTAQRVNLNRDWMLAQTPEMRHMLALVHAWDPLLTLDLHVTDGVRYRHDVSLSMSAMFSLDPQLRLAAEHLHARAIERIRAKGHRPLDFTPVLVDLENPAAGMMVDADAPRFSHVYAMLRNRMGVLVEDHAWDDYASRVRTCQDVIISMLELTAQYGQTWLKLARQADRRSIDLRGETVHLDWRNTLELGIALPSGSLRVEGYAYTVHADAPVIGGRFITYHLDRPETWNIPLYQDIQPVQEATVALPRGGYVIPAAWAASVRPFLDQHRIAYRTIEQSRTQWPAEQMRVDPTQVRFDTQSYQGRLRSFVQGQWMPSVMDITRGSLFVPIDQPRAPLVAHLLEPASPDSLSTWGLFNTAYEVTDHVASHRQLQLVQWMYHADVRIRDLYGEALYQRLPQLRAEYEERLQRDLSFHADPELRLDFWMSQLPHHDPGYNLYPVWRTHQPL